MPPTNHRCIALDRLLTPAVTARVLVVAAHPDDETIGAGGLLARATDAHVAIVTDGAPRDPARFPERFRAAGPCEQYARGRYDELRQAMAIAGVREERVHALKLGDGEAVTMVPSLVRRLVELFSAIDPEIVLTHPYEGGHVDHDATALAVHAALALSRRGHAHEMAMYHAASGELSVHDFVAAEVPSASVHLDPRARRLKTAMLECYASQRAHERYFATEVERYRCAPHYDFGRAPHVGRLFYETGSPVTSSEAWRARATAALRELEVPPPTRAAHAATRSADAGASSASPGSASVAGASPGSPAAPLVSVIVRSVGRATLAEALASISRQTYARIEVVIVDAAGGGAVARAVEAAATGGLDVRLCGGRALARAAAANVGLEAARGDELVFLDDDDWFDPEHVATLVEALRRASNGERVAYAGVECIELPDQAPARRARTYNAPFDPVRLFAENYVPIDAALFARSLLEEGCRFDESLAAYEDWDFWLQASRRTRFVHVPRVGAAYRWPGTRAVVDAAQQEALLTRIYEKWRAGLSPQDYAAILQRACDAAGPPPTAPDPVSTPSRHDAPAHVAGINSRASLTASPNPVPAAGGVGTTRITWRAPDCAAATVRVREGDGPEQKFAGGSEGSAEAVWIQGGRTYTFSLYGEDDRLLASLRVTGARHAPSVADASFLTTKDRFEFDLNGFCVFRGLVPRDVVAEMNRVIDGALKGERPFKFAFVTLSPVFRDFIFDRRVLEICDAWIDPWFRFDHAWGAQVHHDDAQIADLHAGPFDEQSFFQYHWHRGRSTCSCLVFTIFLEPQSGREGGLCVVPGSHKSNLGLTGEDVYDELIGRDNLSVPWIVEPSAQQGDVLVFTEAMMHGTQTWTNRERKRRNVYFKYCYGGMGWPPGDGPEIAALRAAARNDLERRVLQPAYVAAPATPGITADFRFRRRTLTGL